MKILIVVLVFSCLAGTVSAHGPVTTQTQTFGSHVIEFEYDTLGNIVAGDFHIYVVRLLDNSLQSVKYDQAFIKILEKNGSVVLVAHAIQTDQFGGPGSEIGGAISRPGNYVAEISFNQASSQIAYGTFDFNVTSSNSNASNPYPFKYLDIFTLIAGVILGAVGAGVFKSQPKQH